MFRRLFHKKHDDNPDDTADDSRSGGPVPRPLPHSKNLTLRRRITIAQNFERRRLESMRGDEMSRFITYSDRPWSSDEESDSDPSDCEEETESETEDTEDTEDTRGSEEEEEERSSSDTDIDDEVQVVEAVGPGMDDVRVRRIRRKQKRKKSKTGTKQPDDVGCCGRFSVCLGSFVSWFGESVCLLVAVILVLQIGLFISYAVEQQCYSDLLGLRVRYVDTKLDELLDGTIIHAMRERTTSTAATILMGTLSGRRVGFDERPDSTVGIENGYSGAPGIVCDQRVSSADGRHVPVRVFDTCSNFPWDNQTRCEMRVGMDTQCNCSEDGREIWPFHGGWVSKNISDVALNASSSSEGDASYYCTQGFFDEDFRYFYNNVSNEHADAVISEISWVDSSDPRRKFYTFPLRRFMPSKFIDSEAHMCYTNTDPRLCDTKPSGKEVDEETWYKAQFNVMKDVILLMDVSDAAPSTVSWEVNEFMDKSIRRQFPANRIGMIVFDGDGMEVWQTGGRNDEYFDNLANEIVGERLAFPLRDVVRNLTWWSRNRTYERESPTNDLTPSVVAALQKAVEILQEDDGQIVKELSQIVLMTHSPLLNSIAFGLPQDEDDRRWKLDLFCSNCSVADQDKLSDFASLDSSRVTFGGSFVDVFSPAIEGRIDDIYLDFSGQIHHGRKIWLDEHADLYSRGDNVIVSCGVNSPEAGVSGVVSVVFLAEYWYGAIAGDSEFEKKNQLLSSSSRRTSDTLTVILSYVSAGSLSLSIYIVTGIVLTVLYCLLTRCCNHDAMMRTYAILILGVAFVLQRIAEKYITGWATRGLFAETSLDGFFALFFVLFLCIVYGVMPFIACGLLGAYGSRQQKKGNSSSSLSSENQKGSSPEKDSSAISQDLTVGLDVQNYYIYIHQADSKYVGYVPRMVLNPGKLVAIMGHSGAGKSLYFGYLMGTPLGSAKIAGKTDLFAWSNSESRGFKCTVKDMLDLEQLIGVVPQDNVVSSELTVGECVKFNLQFCSVPSFDASVPALLKSLELLPYLDKFSHELSGGTLRRMSISKTIFQAPPVILLDEPASGLDSAMTLSLMRMLKSLGKWGFTILMTVHQPSQEVMNLFDDTYTFCLFDRRMRCLKVPNREKVVDEILRTYVGKEIGKVEGSPLPAAELQLPEDHTFEEKDADEWNDVLTDMHSMHSKAATRGERFQHWMKTFVVRTYYLLCRNILQELRNWKSFFVDFLCVYLLGICFVILFGGAKQFEGTTEVLFDLCLQTRCGDIDVSDDSCSSGIVQAMCGAPKYSVVFNLQFSIVFSMAFVSMCSALFWFSTEKQVILRESRSGVSFFWYYVTRLLVKMVRALMTTFLFCNIILSGVCLEGTLREYFPVLFGVNFTVAALGVVVSLLFPERTDTTEIVMIGITLVVVQIFVSGVFIPVYYQTDVRNPILDIMKYLSFPSYAIQQLFAIETDHYSGQFPKTVSAQWDFYDFTKTHWNTAALYLFGFLWLIIGYVMLVVFYSHHSTRVLNKLKYYIRKVIGEKFQEAAQPDIELEPKQKKNKKKKENETPQKKKRKKKKKS